MKVLFVVALIIPLTTALNCEIDTVLDGAQDYSYTLEVAPDDLEYWKTRGLSFQIYGDFTSDNVNSATVEAGYYTAEGNLVYSVSIDCASSSWTSYVTEKTGIKAAFQSGSVICGEGTWDLWLKVSQPYQMSWIFNGTALQSGTETVEKGNSGFTVTRPIKVRTKYGSHKAMTFKVSTTSSLDRFSFGECMTFTSGLTCPEAKAWVLARSKVALSLYGAYDTMFGFSCIDGTDYFKNVQAFVLPDETRTAESSIGTFCCCVDMTTGLLYNGDRSYCIENLTSKGEECSEMCEVTFEADKFAEGTTEESI